MGGESVREGDGRGVVGWVGVVERSEGGGVGGVLWTEGEVQDCSTQLSEWTLPSTRIRTDSQLNCSWRWRHVLLRRRRSTSCRLASSRIHSRKLRREANTCIVVSSTRYHAAP